MSQYIQAFLCDLTEIKATVADRLCPESRNI